MFIKVPTKTNLSGLHIVFEGSTNYEIAGIRGISHLMEHLLCKNIDHLLKSFELEAVSWNAYTSRDEIVFYMTGLSESIAKYRIDFIESLCKFEFSQEVLDKEKEIVTQELLGYFNDQTAGHYYNLIRLLFNDYSAIGSIQDIKDLTLSDCKDFFDLQFRLPNKIIYCGNDDFSYDTKELVRSIPQNFNFIPKNDKFEFQKFSNDPDVTSVIALSPPQNKDDFHLAILSTKLLAGGLNSPLYMIIREKLGLAYSISMSFDRYGVDGLISLMISTSTEMWAELVKGIEYCFNNMDNLVLEENFNTCISNLKYQKLKSEFYTHSRVEEYISPAEFDIYEKLGDITFEQLKEYILSTYTIDNFIISSSHHEFESNTQA